VLPKENADILLKKAKQLIEHEGGINDSVRKKYRDWMKKQDLKGGEAAYQHIDENGDVFQSVSMAWPNKEGSIQNFVFRAG